VTTRIDNDALMRLRRERLPVGTKGLPLGREGKLTIDSIASAGFSVLGGDLPFPLLTLRESALARNIETMAEYCRDRGVLLAPHGKTTMAPQLFQRQIEAGCWALTAATPSHLELYRSFGVGRILYANEIVEPTVLHWLVDELTKDETFEFYSLVDTPEGVERMASVLDTAGAPTRVSVLIEVGHEGGRTGCRTIADVCGVADAVEQSASLRLAGVAAFEGTLSESVTSPGLVADPVESSSRPIAEFLEMAAASVRVLVEKRFLDTRYESIISAGGSAYFDLVVDSFKRLREEYPFLRLVLRSGCYITHDGGYYEEISPLGRRAPAGSPRLEPALEVWSVVLSRPEPDLVIVGSGKRDVPIDLRPPTPTRIWNQRSGFWYFPPGSAAVVGVSDQHLHLRIDPNAPIRIGDLCACAISHPCTAFDKWRVIPIVDDELTVVDAVRTFF
jgi:D-serine dehydratase